MENLAFKENLTFRNEMNQEQLRNKTHEEPNKIEERISSVFNNIYHDVKNLNEAYLEDTKVEAGGE